ncbi:MAG: hypothetical protein KDK08_17210, partial [Rhizobiaceae bacterium]|nr:hypothetical protein [Rhizobiaceae bacterium]
DDVEVVHVSCLWLAAGKVCAVAETAFPRWCISVSKNRTDGEGSCRHRPGITHDSEPVPCDRLAFQLSLASG